MPIKKIFTIYALLQLGLLSEPNAYCQDKSSTREGLVKLPGSGGTVQKDGTSFTFSSSRGTAGYTIPLPELPTRGGMRPSLTLSYSQSAGDSGSGLGIGWSISNSSIAVNDDLGTAFKSKRTDNDDFASHIALDGQRLIPHAANQAGSDYQYSLESGSAYVNIRYTKNPVLIDYLGPQGEALKYSFSGGFIVTNAEGQKSYYAEDKLSAETDPNTPGHSVRWPITMEVNPRGEAINYHYVKFGQRSYLKDIEFAAGQSQYVFELIETRPSLVSHKSAFRQVNTVLYGSVSAVFKSEVQAQTCFGFVGRDAGSDRFTVRSGEKCKSLARSDLANLVDDTQTHSLNVLDQLRAVYRAGKGGEFVPENMFPKINFAYSNWNQASNNRNIVFPVKSLEQTSSATHFELFDYNLDALVDLIRTDDQKVSVSLGEADLESSFNQTMPWSLERDGKVVYPKLNSPSWHFVEMNGDSLTDLVEIEAGKVHMYLRLKDGTFAKGTTIEIPWIKPQLFENQAFRWIDINNDGLTDLLGTEIIGNSTVWKLAINQTVLTDSGVYDFYFLESNQKLPFKTNAGDLLQDPLYSFSDVNGDQLLDLIRVVPEKSGICVYENKGDVYANSETMLFADEESNVLSQTNCDQGHFIAIAGLSHDLQTVSRRIWFLDANGDGILDLTSFSSNDTELKVWLGFGNGDFLSEPLRFPTVDKNGRPQVSVQAGRDRTRVADIDGDGQSEIVVFQAGIPGLEPVVVIDFNRLAETQLIKSNLLTTITDETGIRYDLRYTSSIDELVRDNNHGIESSPLHFPMYVVKQIVISEADPEHPGTYKDGPEVREMLYHYPIYDVKAKKLVGYHEVETINYGDEYLGNKKTQETFYKREVFANDYRLTGSVLESHISEYAPLDSFARQSEESAALSLDDITLHTMKNYSKTQDAIQPGRPISSEYSEWKLIPKVKGYDGEVAYYRRLLNEKREFNSKSGETAINSTTYNDHDEYNISWSRNEDENGFVSPSGIAIPARSLKIAEKFGKTRTQLEKFGILTLPDEETIVQTDGMLAKPLTQVINSYTDSGLLNEKFKKVFYDLQNAPAGWKEPSDEKQNFGHDGYGNVVMQALNDVALETVSFDAQGVFPIKSTNAAGHTTLISYGSDEISSCPSTLRRQVPAAQINSYRNPLGVCHHLSYDDLNRRTQLLRNDGYLENYEYRLAKNGLPSRILKSSLRYKDASEVPAGASQYVLTLEANSSLGKKVATAEVTENDKGTRVLDFTEYNRKKNPQRKWTPFQDETIGIRQVFESGIIPRASANSAIAFVYDGLDRPTFIRYPTGRSEQVLYEAWGQEIRSTYDQGHGTGPTSVSKLVVKRGDQVYGSVDTLGNKVTYAYDAYNNITEILLPGESTPRTYSYDSFGKKLKECAPALGCTYFGFNILGYPDQKIVVDNKGLKKHEVTYFYDVIGRLNELLIDGVLNHRNYFDSYPEGRAPAGATKLVPGLQTISENIDGNEFYNTATVFQYDDIGRIHQRGIQYSESEKVQSFVDTMEYTLDGALSEGVDPYGVRSVYNLAPSLRFRGLDVYLPWKKDTKETIIENISYNAKGQMERVDYREGSKSYLAYDPETLFMTAIQTTYRNQQGHDAWLQNAALEFDGNGSVTEINDLVDADSNLGLVNRSGKFFYNKRDELIKAERYGESLEYGYDAQGNFTSNPDFGDKLTDPSTETKIMPRSNAELVYKFNSLGQIQSRLYKAVVTGKDEYKDLQKRHQIVDTRYDGLGRLVYLKTDSTLVYYGYDVEGKRLYKRVKPIGAGDIKDTLFPNKNTIVEPTGAQSFVSVNDRRLARIEHDANPMVAGHWYYYLLDHLGSTDFTMHSDGRPVEQMLYRPYGTELSLGDSALGLQFLAKAKEMQSILPKERTHHRFTGQYLDDDSGLYYYGSRYYDPLLGRFVSADPMYMEDPSHCVESPLECNLYGYVRNNPMKFVDPTGTHIAAPMAKDADGKEHYTITVTAVIVNNSSTPMSSSDLQKSADRIKASIEKAYTKTWDGGNKYSTVKVDIVRADQMSFSDKVNDFFGLSKGRHSFEFVDKIGDSSAIGQAHFGQHKIELVQGLSGGALPGGGTLERTAPHEFGHSASLRHPVDRKNTLTLPTDNLMSQTKLSKSTEVEGKQIEAIHEAYTKGELNH